jgi:hypothetical protein
VYIAVLVAWTVVDPPAAVQYRQSLGPDQYMMVCQTGESGIILFGIILGWSCVLLLVGIVLSFLTRNLAEAYNESKPVSMSVYIYSFSAVILIPILFSKLLLRRVMCQSVISPNTNKHCSFSCPQCTRGVYCNRCSARVQYIGDVDRAVLDQDCAHPQRSRRQSFISLQRFCWQRCHAQHFDARHGFDISRRK